MLQRAARAVSGVQEEVGQVVWSTGAGELLVRLDGIGLQCAPGAVTIIVPVACDQLPAGVSIAVLFGVGSPTKPAGLLMSTLDRPVGPEVIVKGWGEALTALAWESLLRVAITACAAVGTDGSGQPLVPELLGADRDQLLVQPVGGHG